MNNKFLCTVSNLYILISTLNASPLASWDNGNFNGPPPAPILTGVSSTHINFGVFSPLGDSPPSIPTDGEAPPPLDVDDYDEYGTPALVSPYSDAESNTTATLPRRVKHTTPNVWLRGMSSRTSSPVPVDVFEDESNTPLPSQENSPLTPSERHNRAPVTFETP